MYENLYENTSQEERDVVMQFGKIEVDSACAWPNRWIRQGKDVRHELVQRRRQYRSEQNMQMADPKEAESSELRRKTEIDEKRDQMKVEVDAWGIIDEGAAW